MKANSSHVNFNDGRLRDHQRQQEKLKAMASTVDKIQMVSADQLIENLLKEPFKKLPQTSIAIHQVDHSNADLPVWLQCENDAVPPHYKYLWSLVHLTTDVADTQKVSQLLLTSGLQVDILGFIWNLANKKIPGQLTKQEFFIVLALVSLAQSGYSFNNLSVLKLMTVPLIPVLQVGLQKYPAHQFNTLQNSETAGSTSNELLGFSASLSKPFTNLSESEKNEDNFDWSAEKRNISESECKNSSISPREVDEFDIVTSNNAGKPTESFLKEQKREFHKSKNFPCIGSSPTAELEDDFSAFQSVPIDKVKEQKSITQLSVDSKDDFTDFQSAIVEHSDPFEAVVINQKKEVPKIPFPKAFTGKFKNLKSTVLKISPETEKKLKILSSSESLSSLPESKISSNNKVSTSLSVLGSNHGIGSRLANHTVRLDSKVDKPKCHKHHKINLHSISSMNSSSEEEIILGVKPRSLESVIPKCNPKNLSTCKTFILKETKIKNDESADDSPRSEVESSSTHSGKNTRQIEIPMLGTFNETVLPTQSKSESSDFDLLTVQEDKYSALRGIELGMNQENAETKGVSDDFGDFLSADIPTNPETEPSTGLAVTLTSNSNSVTSKEVEKDDWGDWNFNVDPVSLSAQSSEIDVHQRDVVSDTKEVKETFEPENVLLDIFSSLSLSKESNPTTSQPNFFLQEEQDYFNVDIKVDNTPNKKNQKLDDLSVQSQEDQGLNPNPDDEFWEFISTDLKPQSRDVSRHSSIPSLDLKISPIDESEHEIVWRKCLDSCHNLIQEGYEIFNNIGTKCVLDEVFAAPKTGQYLNNLNIVFQISKRITQNFNNFPSSQEEMEKLWVRLQDLCFEYNIKLKHDEDDCGEGKIRCNICLKRIGYNIINQGNSSYHASCANLWINCVEPILPSF